MQNEKPFSASGGMVNCTIRAGSVDISEFEDLLEFILMYILWVCEHAIVQIYLCFVLVFGFVSYHTYQLF